MLNRMKIFVRAQACTKPPSPIGESEDLETPPPIRESEDLDALGDLENFSIASARTPPSPLLGKVKIWTVWEIKKILPLQVTETCCIPDVNMKTGCGLGDHSFPPSRPCILGYQPIQASLYMYSCTLRISLHVKILAR